MKFVRRARAAYPATPEEVFEAYVTDWRTTFGHGVQAILLYGSGARGEYRPGKSDLNFLVVLAPEAIAKLREAVPLTEKWRARNVAVPLVLTQQYIQASLDSFPIEFLNLKRHHQVVMGEPVLRDLEIPREQLRLQLERELKGKLLHLRGGFLEAGHDRRALRALILGTVPAFVPLFEALLYLRDEAIPAKRREIYEKIARVAGLEEGFIAEVFRLEDREFRPYHGELWSILERYIAQVKKLTQFVDSM